MLLLTLLEKNQPTVDEIKVLSKEANKLFSDKVKGRRINRNDLNSRISLSQGNKNGIISTGSMFI